jgi:hypothetical protein
MSHPVSKEMLSFFIGFVIRSFLGVDNLPESYKDALAGVTATFHKFSANFIALGSFREGFPTNNKRHRKWSIP